MIGVGTSLATAGLLVAVTLFDCVATAGQAQAAASAPVPVTVENFRRAESDRYFGIAVQKGGLGRFDHRREPMPIDHQTVIRANRDTLYSSAVFDLDAGPGRSSCPTRATASCRCR